MKSSKTATVACWLAVAALTASVALAQTPAKAAAPVKGKAVISTLTVTATVTKINHKTREVTLKTEDGQEYSLIASNDVKNLAQVQKGDVVTASYTEALAYEVKKGGAAGASTAVTGGSAPAGAKPAGAIAQRTTLTVTIAAIDLKAPSVTFKGPEGNTRTIKVAYPEKLQDVKVGDTVELTYTEALAVKVEKAPKK
jgi:hypothetical protein